MSPFNKLITRFIAFLVPVTALVLMTGTYLNYQATERVLEEGLDAKVAFKLETLAKLASGYLQSFEVDLIEEMMVKVRSEAEVVYVAIVNRSGQVEYGEIVPAESLRIYREKIPAGEGPQFKHLGTLEMGIDTRRYQATLYDMLLKNVVLMLVMIAVLLLTTTLFFRQMISRPTQALTRAAEQIVKGEPEQIPEFKRSDELALLAASFRVMVSHLHASQRNLLALNDSLEQQVEERSQALMEAIQETQEQKSEIDLILNAMNEGLMVVDSEGVVQCTNSRLLQMVGKENTALIGQPLSLFFADGEQLRRQLVELFEQREEEGKTFSVQTQLKASGGFSIPVQLSSVLLARQQEGHSIADGEVLILHDLRNRMQDEYAAFQASVAEMSAMILHNIGNSLTGMRGGVIHIGQRVNDLRKLGQVLGKLQVLVEEQQQHCLTVDSGCQERLEQINKALEQTVESLLPKALNEIEQEHLASINLSLTHIAEIIQVQQKSAKGQAERSLFLLSDAVRDALVMQRDMFDRIGIEVVEEYPHAPQVVELPRNQMVQVLNNLLKNSREAIIEQIQAEPDHQGRLTLAITQSSDGACLSVSDNGIGITAEQQEKLFGFGYTSKEEGNGFGLHASATFIRGQGGEITASSEGIGRGATFTITLPCGGK